MTPSGVEDLGQIDNGLSRLRRKFINLHNGDLWLAPMNKLQWNFNQYVISFIQEIKFEYNVCKILFGSQCVNMSLFWHTAPYILSCAMTSMSIFY